MQQIIMAHQQVLMEGLIRQYKMLAAKSTYCSLPDAKLSMSDQSNPPAAPGRDATLTLREITKDNWRAVANLRLPPHQESNLASNPMSMVEAHYSEDAWMRAVYADEFIVGFLMMAIWPPTDGYYIWRFMVDERYQKLGFGRRVVEMAIRYLKETYPQAKKLGLMSTPKEGKEDVRPEDSPYAFYVKLGFEQVAEPDEDNEVLMEIDL
jgi:diamine N-acetyltransferase